jgi:hypothetical protein
LKQQAQKRTRKQTQYRKEREKIRNQRDALGNVNNLGETRAYLKSSIHTPNWKNRGIKHQRQQQQQQRGRSSVCLRSTLSLEVEETFAAGLWPELLRTYVGARSSGCTLRQRRSFGAATAACATVLEESTLFFGARKSAAVAYDCQSDGQKMI